MSNEHRVRAGGSEHADFPQRGKSAPIQASLSSPSERNHARSAFIGAPSPQPSPLSQKRGIFGKEGKLTTELERIKILESKISHVIEFINKLMGENEKLKQQVKELKAEKKSFEEQAQKMGKIDEEMKTYQKEREAVKGKIEAIISQIDRIGI